MFEFAKIYYWIFGLLTIAGGIMGYMKGSTISLLAGGVSGALLIAAALLLSRATQPAFILALVVSIALAGRFLPAFLHGKGFIPHGMMALLSVASLVITLAAWYKR